MNHNFIISIIDTDSCTVNKPDGSEFSQQEINDLTLELNSMYPELINWEFEFYIPKIIVVKSKNYILYDGNKIKTKGSSIRDQKKEPVLKEMMDKIIDTMIFDKQELLNDIYESYISEALHVTDIKRWASKKTITAAILKCRGWTEEDILEKRLRRNEVEVWEAIKHLPDLQEGGKVWVYPAVLGSSIERKEYKNGNVKEKIILDTGIKTIDKWEGDHNREKLIERVRATTEIFENVLDISQFVDYTKSKNKYLLEGRII